MGIYLNPNSANFEVTLMDGKRILSLSYQELQKK